MTIPHWLVNTLAVVGFVAIWAIFSAFIAFNLVKFMKEDDCE